MLKFPSIAPSGVKYKKQEGNFNNRIEVEVSHTFMMDYGFKELVFFDE